MRHDNKLNPVLLTQPYLQQISFQLLLESSLASMKEMEVLIVLPSVMFECDAQFAVVPSSHY